MDVEINYEIFNKIKEALDENYEDMEGIQGSQQIQNRADYRGKQYSELVDTQGIFYKICTGNATENEIKEWAGLTENIIDTADIKNAPLQESFTFGYNLASQLDTQKQKDDQLNELSKEVKDLKEIVYNMKREILDLTIRIQEVEHK